MPTVLEADGFRVRILLPPREHPPPHVHVARAGAEVVLLLPQGIAGVVVRTVDGLRDADVVAAVRLVEANEALLMRAWRKYQGGTATECRADSAADSAGPCGGTCSAQARAPRPGGAL